MKYIESADNPIYRGLINLKNKKTRDKEKKYLLEGPHLIDEAIKANIDLETIIVSENNKEELAKANLSDNINSGTNIIQLSDRLFVKLADTVNHQGIMAVARQNEIPWDEFIKTDKKKHFIIIDRLQDPGNVGTILRTALAAGFKGAVIVKGTVDIYNQKIVRSAAGALFMLPIYKAESAEEVVSLFKRADVNLIAAVPGKGTIYYEYKIKKSQALIIGNEGNGISKEFLDNAEKIQIPMEEESESLNAAIAAAVLMFYIKEQEGIL